MDCQMKTHITVENGTPEIEALTNAFFIAVAEARSSLVIDDEDRAVERAISLQIAIENRLMLLRAELNDLERAERSHEWFHVSLERSRMRRNNA